ncbi:hypothetical protein ABIB38_004752, partial [Massilia sp. UYP11]
QDQTLQFNLCLLTLSSHRLLLAESLTQNTDRYFIAEATYFFFVNI